jgi:glycosyltransferase involved in cell wall biosynthesis
VRREKQSFAQGPFVIASAKRGISTLEALGQKKIPVWLCPVEGDIVAGAKELAGQMIRDRIDLAIFDATQADAIAAIASSWEIARAKINLCRRTPLYAPQIGTIAYTEQARFKADRDFWDKRNIEARCILEGIDVEEISSAAPNRTAYGIPDNAVVLATAGTDLDRTVGEEFVETMINVLRSHPQSILLLVGDGELAWQKRKFESSGVSKRVGYAGRRKDLPGFLRIADLYIAEYPNASAGGVLQAMSVERAIVAMAGGEAAQFAGDDASTAANDASAFIERISKLIREPAQRTKLGKSMRQRVEQQFCFSQTARSIEQMCHQAVQQSAQSQVKAQAA